MIYSLSFVKLFVFFFIFLSFLRKSRLAFTLGPGVPDSPGLVHAVQYRRRFSIVPEESLVEDRQPIRQGQDLFQFVGQDNKGFTGLFEGNEDFQHLDYSGPVQVGEGFIHDDHPATHGQDPRHGEAPFFSAGKAAGGTFPLGFQAHSLQGGYSPAFRFFPGKAKVLRAEGGVFFHGFPQELGIGVLEDQAQFPPQGESSRKGLSPEQDLPFPGFQEARHAAHEEGFSRSVGTSHEEEFPFPYIQVYPVQGGKGGRSGKTDRQVSD
jgi:hypothetical protein